MSAGVSYVVAFGGGVASFVSPCVLPVVPAYLAVITGVDVTDVAASGGRRIGRIARDTSLFIIGFGTVFVLLGVTATAVGETLNRNKVEIGRISGIVVVVMAVALGASLVGSSRLASLGLLSREARFHPSLRRLGPFAAPVAGAAFGFGWTPCIGPVLASVSAVALTERGVGQGALLLAVYALGLGVPFLVVGCGFGRVAGALGFVRRHTRVITGASCALLAAFGVLLILNRLTVVTSDLESALRAIGLGGLVTAG